MKAIATMIVLLTATQALAYPPIHFGPAGPYVQVAPGWVTPVYPPAGAYVPPSQPVGRYAQQGNQLHQRYAHPEAAARHKHWHP